MLRIFLKRVKSCKKEVTCYLQVLKKKGLIMSDRKGVEAAKCMLMRAGLPVQVIDRVLLQDRAFNKFIRKSNLT